MGTEPITRNRVDELLSFPLLTTMSLTVGDIFPKIYTRPKNFNTATTATMTPGSDVQIAMTLIAFISLWATVVELMRGASSGKSNGWNCIVGK